MSISPTFILPQQVAEAISRLEAAGFEARIVGGSVRDFLRGVAPNDYDITTAALPEEVRKVFSDSTVVDTGIKHGTVTVILQGMPLEITTFRVEEGYTDHRHPGRVSFTDSLTADLGRRDFTVNAMAYSPSRGLFDPYEGQKDLAAGIIRCVGNPKERFDEDALRILRALRFSSCLGFPLEQTTRQAAWEVKDSLGFVSAERIFAELKKLLCGKDVKRVLLEEAGILGVVLPELLPMKGFDQRNYHHIYDVLTHTAVAVENLPPDPVLRLAGLFHDMGKPACFTLDSAGVGHFKGHPAVSAAMAEEILRRLKCDNDTRERVVRLVKWHDVVIEPNEKAVKRVLRQLSPDALEDLLWIKTADNLAQAPQWQGRIASYQIIRQLKNDILARQDCFSMKDLAIKGGDLLARGLTPGPRLGKALSAALEAVVEGNVANEKDMILAYLEKAGLI